MISFWFVDEAEKFTLVSLLYFLFFRFYFIFQEMKRKIECILIFPQNNNLQFGGNISILIRQSEWTRKLLIFFYCCLSCWQPFSVFLKVFLFSLENNDFFFSKDRKFWKFIGGKDPRWMSDFTPSFLIKGCQVRFSVGIHSPLHRTLSAFDGRQWQTIFRSLCPGAFVL